MPSKAFIDNKRKPKDLIGFKQGSLIVLSDSGLRTNNAEIIWKVSCECGRIIHLDTSSLRGGKKSCGICKSLESNKINNAKAKTTKSKRKNKSFTEMSAEDKEKALAMLFNGHSVSRIGKYFNVNPNTLKEYFSTLKENLNISLALNEKLLMIKKDPLAVKPVNTKREIESVLSNITIDKKLEEFTSPLDSEHLTPEELAFCWLLSTTGSITAALEESGFLSILSVNKPSYVQILGTYLSQKPNLKSYISQLQTNKELELNITRDMVQSELVTQILQLKDRLASNTNNRQLDRGYLLKAIELLGKSVAAFTDRVEVQEVDPKKALDTLIEMAQSDIESTYRIEEAN